MSRPTERAAERTVRVAVALLPKHLRPRYREQWQGELRDAASVGIPQIEIAKGALAVAAGIKRPLPRWVRTTPPRLSFALALSAAVISLSNFAGIVPVSNGFTTTVWGSVASTPLIAWIVLIPAVALIMILAARRATRRERIAVTLLAIASYLPFFHDPIDSLAAWQAGAWLTFGAYTYAAGTIFSGIAVILVWREYRPSRASAKSTGRATRLLHSGLAGLVVGGVIALCSLNESASWESRKLAVWVEPLTNANRTDFTEWLAGWKMGENMVVTTLAVWLVTGFVVAVAIALSGLHRNATLGRTIALAAGAVSLALVSYGGVLMFLQIVSASVVTNVPVDTVMFAGRLGMLVVVLATFSRGRGYRSAVGGMTTSTSPVATS